ncbi:hypothetical protein D3C75_348970 [compost metagenome]
MGHLAAIGHRCPGGIVTGDAEVSFLRHIEGVQIRVVIDGVTAGVFHIHRRTGTIAHQHRAVEVTHQVRTGWHLHNGFVDTGIRIETVNSATLLTLQVRNIHQR